MKKVNICKIDIVYKYFMVETAKTIIEEHNVPWQFGHPDKFLRCTVVEYETFDC